MDIDDILLSAERSALQAHADPFGVEGGEYGGYGQGAEEYSPEADLRALTRAWVNERAAPEVLEWPADNLIERVSERIKKQIEKVEEMTGDMDPKTNFGLIVVQTELERWKYLVRGFLRARLAKIDKHTLHYLSTPSLTARLSPTEIAYATRHQSLLHQHYLSSFLGGFPANLQNLNDTAGGINMIGGPDEEGGVVVRGVGESFVYEARGRDRDGGVEVQRGEVVVARWADVREGVVRGSLELV